MSEPVRREPNLQPDLVCIRCGASVQPDTTRCASCGSVIVPVPISLLRPAGSSTSSSGSAAAGRSAGSSTSSSGSSAAGRSAGGGSSSGSSAAGRPLAGTPSGGGSPSAGRSAGGGTSSSWPLAGTSSGGGSPSAGRPSSSSAPAGKSPDASQAHPKGLNGSGAAADPGARHAAPDLPGKSLFQHNHAPRSYPKIRLYRQGELSPIAVIVISAVVSFLILLAAFLWVFMNNPNAGLLVVVALFGPFIFARLAATWYDQMLRNRLRQQGRATEAHVVDLWIEHETSDSGSEATEGTFYMVAYQFSVGLGSQARTLTLQEGIKEEFYSQLKQGQAVRIFYMEEQPEIALVEYSPTEPSAGRSL